ncbi:MAG: hypothetical protein R2822_23000 [Spirosomataceae bacterium]
MKALITLFAFFNCLMALAQKPVSPDLAINGLVINERSATMVSVSFILKNNGPGAFAFKGSPSTPIDDFQVGIYLSKDDKLDKGNLNGINDLLLGNNEPAGTTLNEGSSVKLTVRLPVSSPNYDAYKFLLVELNDNSNTSNNVAGVAYNFSFEPPKSSGLPLEKPSIDPNRPTAPARKNGNNEK